MIPILITVPFGDTNQEGKSSERETFEEKVIDVMTRGGEEDIDFYHTFYFYPYKNPNPRGNPLTPNQLAQVFEEELDFFLPEIKTIYDLRKEFDRGKRTARDRNYTHPFIPPHRNKFTGKQIIYEGDREEWEIEPYVVVIDDLDLKWGRLFYVQEEKCKWRFYRQFNRTGEDVEEELKQKGALIFLDEENASDTYCSEDEGERKIDPDYYQDENKFASDWLGLDSPRKAYMYAIQASFFLLQEMSLPIANLQEGNLFFFELMPEKEEIEGVEEAIQKELQELSQRWIDLLNI